MALDRILGGCFMLKYDRLELPEAIDKYLEVKQSQNAKFIRKAVRKKKRKDLKIGEKLSALFDLHYYKSRAIELAELIKSYKDFNVPNKVYQMPLDLRKELEYVGSNMSSAEVNQLLTQVNQSISQFYMTSRMDVVSKNGKLRRILKKARQEGRYMTYWENGKPVNDTLLAGIDKLYQGKITSLDSTKKSSFVKINANGIEKEEAPLTEEEIYLQDVEEMLRKGELQENDITRNIDKIRETFRERSELEQLNIKIWNVICGLKKESKESGIDFSKAIRILQTVYGRNRKVMDGYDNYLVKFDFASLEEKITWVKGKRKQEAWVRQKLEALDQVSQITPRNPNVSEMIKENIRVTMSAKKDLRNLAIHSLRVNGRLEEDHFHLGNLVISNPVDKEAEEILIRKKIDEMISVASKSPEERAVDYLKEMKMVSETATVADLSEQQIEDYKFAFRDDSYDFDIERIRQIKNIIDSQRREKATTICREYIKYRAKLKDKSTAVTFSEYARTLYLQENMDLSMVEEDVISMDSSMLEESAPSMKR